MVLSTVILSVLKGNFHFNFRWFIFDDHTLSLHSIFNYLIYLYIYNIESLTSFLSAFKLKTVQYFGGAWLSAVAT